MKQCTKCGRTLPETEFYLSNYKRKRDGKKGRQAHCKRCQAQASYLSTVQSEDYAEKESQDSATKPRTCTVCGETKEYYEFYLSSHRRADGTRKRRNQCRQCKSKAVRDRYKGAMEQHTVQI